MSFCCSFLTCAAWHIDTNYFFRSDQVCCRQFFCLSCTLLNAPWLNWHYFPKGVYSCLMVFLMTYERGALTTQWHDLRYFLMASLVPVMSALLTWGSTSGIFLSSLNIFWPASRQTVSCNTPLLSNQKCSSTYDGIGRWQASSSPGLWLKHVALCKAPCQHS